MNSSVSKILSYFFPDLCLSCHSVFEFGEEENFCEPCKKEIIYLGKSICRICGEDLQNPDISNSLCGECLQDPPHFEWARSVFQLTPSLSKVIYSFKYAGDETALSWMAEELGLFLNHHFSSIQFDFIVPVPLHMFRLLRRGYNQSLLLAKALAKSRGEKLDFENLQKQKSTLAQSTLSKKDRTQQLRGAFSLKGQSLFREKNILLLDDVYTTGTTLRECTQVLSKADAKVFVLSLARTPLLSL